MSSFDESLEMRLRRRIDELRDQRDAARAAELDARRRARELATLAGRRLRQAETWRERARAAEWALHGGRLRR